MAKMKMSYSKLTCFEQCPLKFKYQYILRYPTTTSPALMLGSAIHSALEKVYNLPRSERTLDILKNIFRREWKCLKRKNNFAMERDKEIEIGKNGLSMLDTFWDSSFMKDPDPVQREEFVDAELHDGSGEKIVFLGRIDRLDQLCDGTYAVVDYKTGKLNERFIDFTQLRAYALLMHKQDKQVSSSVFYYLPANKLIKEQMSPETFTTTEQELYRRSKAVYDAIEHDCLEADPGKLCPWCDFKGICPAK